MSFFKKLYVYNIYFQIVNKNIKMFIVYYFKQVYRFHDQNKIFNSRTSIKTNYFNELT